MSKKRIVIKIVLYLIILFVIGWLLNEMIDAKVRAGKFEDLADHSIKKNRLLREENESLKKQLKEIERK